jgi:membrane protein implicated in regulation of membrane protease activity
MILYIIAAAIFGIAELMTGTFWLVAVAVVCSLMAGVLWVFPDINLFCHLITLGILSFSTYKVMKRYRGFDIPAKEDLNNPLLRYVGYEGRVVSDAEDGKVRVSVADTQWTAVGLDESVRYFKGQKIKVVSASLSAVLTIVPAD